MPPTAGSSATATPSSTAPYPGLGLHPAGSGLPNSLNAPIVGMVPSIDDNGYFMVASDGGVFAFGDAHFAGSCPGIGGCSGAAVAVMPDAQRQRLLAGDLDGKRLHVRRRALLRCPGPRHRDLGRAHSRRVGLPGPPRRTVRSSPTATPPPTARPPPPNFNGFDPASSIFSTSDGAGYWVSRPRRRLQLRGRAQRRRDVGDPSERADHRRHRVLTRGGSTSPAAGLSLLPGSAWRWAQTSTPAGAKAATISRQKAPRSSGPRLVTSVLMPRRHTTTSRSTQ